jgi:hypothetical protein
MKVRIEAQRRPDGTMRCELVFTGRHGAEVHVPAVLADPEDEAIIAGFADGALFALEVEAPLLQSVSVDVRGVE